VGFAILGIGVAEVGFAIYPSSGSVFFNKLQTSSVAPKNVFSFARTNFLV